MLKALDTNYRGFRFRSRLEARWAVFMDEVGIKYEYEREAYDLDGLCYLPDFWLPELDAFLEIKALAPNYEESEKARRLAKASGKTVFILIGQPECQELGRSVDGTHAEMFSWLKIEDGEWVAADISTAEQDNHPPGWPSLSDVVFAKNGRMKEQDGWDAPYLWCECPHCLRCELQFDGRADRISCACAGSNHGDKGYNSDSARLKSAYAKARGYRFEPNAFNK